MEANNRCGPSTTKSVSSLTAAIRDRISAALGDGWPGLALSTDDWTSSVRKKDGPADVRSSVFRMTSKNFQNSRCEDAATSPSTQEVRLSLSDETISARIQSICERRAEASSMIADVAGSLGCMSTWTQNVAEGRPDLGALR